MTFTIKKFHQKILIFSYQKIVREKNPIFLLDVFIFTTAFWDFLCKPTAVSLPRVWNLYQCTPDGPKSADSSNLLIFRIFPICSKILEIFSILLLYFSKPSKSILSPPCGGGNPYDLITFRTRPNQNFCHCQEAVNNMILTLYTASGPPQGDLSQPSNSKVKSVLIQNLEYFKNFRADRENPQNEQI